MASLSDILTSLQHGVLAIQGLNRTFQSTFLQSGVVVSSAITVVGSTITFNSSTVAGFLSVQTSSGIAYYLPLYR